MVIAFLTADNRQVFHEYSKLTPYFGTAPQGLLAGFAELVSADFNRQATSDEMFSLKPPFLNDTQYPEFVEIHVISCTQQPMQSPEKLADNIWFHSLHVPKWGWLKTGYLGCILSVRQKLREIKPDIVHAQGTERDCAMSAIFTPHAKLLTIHGNLRLIRQTVRFNPFLLLQSALEGFVVPRFDGVICITNYTRNAVECDAKRTWVVPNAVDPAFLKLGEKREFTDHRSSTKRPIVLVVGTVDARKNQVAFIRSLDLLAHEKSFFVKFFGRCADDEYGKEFRSLVAERSWCQYGGMIGRQELLTEFANASFLSLPSHEDNCPMVVLEAQAVGIPVMASNVGGVPDLVEDEVTGLLSKPDQPDTMANALRRLLENSELAERLAKNGRIQSLQRFHPRIIAQRHLEVYRELSGR